MAECHSCGSKVTWLSSYRDGLCRQCAGPSSGFRLMDAIGIGAGVGFAIAYAMVKLDISFIRLPAADTIDGAYEAGYREGTLMSWIGAVTGALCGVAIRAFVRRRRL